MNQSAITFRPDINGLRAVSVLMVVLNHAGYSFIPGGHIGVDVFFVISGYLITRIILFEVSMSSFSLRDFYLRRIRRILPAVIFVLIICLPVSYWLMLPSELENFAKASIGAVFFVSNLVLWKQGGYFDVDAALSPLLHLWSLAVEEQFYLLFPLVVLGGVALKRRALMALLCVLTGGSFFLLMFTYQEMPRASFFLLPTRAWELLVGSVIGLAHSSRKNQPTNPLWVRPLPFAGLFIILVSAWFIDKSTIYPGPATVWPVLGAAMIVGAPNSESLVHKLLSLKLFQVIGLASFSIYLWHQPLLVFGRLISADYLSRGERNFAVFLILIVGIATWYLVERSTRSKERVSTKSLIVGISISSLLVVGVSSFVLRNEGFPNRLPPNIQWESAGQRPQRVCANGKDWEIRDQISLCVFGDRESVTNVFLIGDSHADSLINELDVSLRNLGLRGFRVSLAECSEIPGSYLSSQIPSDLGRCQERFNSLLRVIEYYDATTILSMRWTFRLYPVPGQIGQLEATNSDGGHEVEDYREYVIANSKGVGISAELKREAIEQLLSGLLESSKKVVVIGPVPEVAWNIARLNLTHFRTRGKVLDSVSIAHSDYESRNQFVLRIFEDLELRGVEKLQVVYPSNQLCNSYLEARCVAQVDGLPLYLDDDHLSDDGARLVIQEVEFLNSDS